MGDSPSSDNRASEKEELLWAAVNSDGSRQENEIIEMKRKNQRKETTEVSEEELACFVFLSTDNGPNACGYWGRDALKGVQQVLYISSAVTSHQQAVCTDL